MGFSIVITTYNRADLLPRAIQSALHQTVPGEVVVVDDASTDDTAAYVQSLGDRVRYHRNATNQGHSACINIGVELAQGDWIKPLDDDDYLAPQCLAEMARAIALCPQPVLCSCQAAQVNLAGEELWCTPRAGAGLAFYIPQADIHYAMLLERAPLGTTTQVAFQRQAFLRSGGWNSALDINSDDSDSWIRIAQFGDVVFINQRLAFRTLWAGAYNYQVSYRDRLHTNFLVKQKLYDLIAAQAHPQLPTLDTMHAYLQLHWGLVACKHHRLREGLALLVPHLLHIPAWQLLLQAIQFRHHQTPHPQIATPILIPAANPASVISQSVA